MPGFKPLFITVKLFDRDTGKQVQTYRTDYNNEKSRHWLTQKVLVWAFFNNKRVEAEAEK